MLSSLDTFKTISFITGAALAINKAMKDKLEKRAYFVTNKKQQKRNEAGAVIAGLVGVLWPELLLHCCWLPSQVKTSASG